MVDISYSAGAKRATAGMQLHNKRTHTGVPDRGEEVLETEMRGKCGGVEHEVRRKAAATAKLKITYMHHGGMVDVPNALRDHKMQRDGENG